MIIAIDLYGILVRTDSVHEVNPCKGETSGGYEGEVPPLIKKSIFRAMFLLLAC